MYNQGPVLLGNAVEGSLPFDDLSLNKYSLEFNYEHLRDATGNFDTSRLLGKGGFGQVYRGEEKDGTEFAVKAITVAIKDSGFEEEVRVLSKFRHPHLVILMGFARHKKQRFLVYELLDSDVYKRIQQCSDGRKAFYWSERINVAYDAACGLSHLHLQNPKVFHRDIKTPNILLTRSGTAKVADFGLACLTQDKAHWVGNVCGTVGYICPRYAQTKVITERAEVYAYGIVLFEILCATPAAWKKNSGGHGTQQEYDFLTDYFGGDLNRVMDRSDKKASWPTQLCKDMARLALSMTAFPGEDKRPLFPEVVKTLRALRDKADKLDINSSDATSPRGNPYSPKKDPYFQRPQDQQRHFKQEFAANQTPYVKEQQKKHTELMQKIASRSETLRSSSSEMKLFLAQNNMRKFAPPPGSEVLLWSLSVIWVRGRNVLVDEENHNLVLEYRTSMEKGGIVSLVPMMFGRTDFQPFLEKILPEGMVSCISRQHFEISAEVKPQAQIDGDELHKTPWGPRIPCVLKLKNLSGNIVGVGGETSMRVETKQETQLRDGDLISLCIIPPADQRGHSNSDWEPCLVFRFQLGTPSDLSEVSYLRDVSRHTGQYNVRNDSRSLNFSKEALQTIRQGSGPSPKAASVASIVIPYPDC
eukprot:TRINITY_DN11495_c0_g1_i1.p1 TRINITY_DN11495_c0_g1~~TRINITY_DN11495_c0_g1_i1.p1  ORF type:complete len:643 (-),score=102.71 TRINITY_DN11495_c0_g1_i1:145-2073(-)